MVKRQTERSILRSVVTCGIFSLLILESTCAEVRAQTTIRLQEDVVLHQSPVIRLGDIAQVSDLSAAMVSAFEDLELLPISSREMEVTRETIRDRLGLLGVDLYGVVAWARARETQRGKVSEILLWWLVTVRVNWLLSSARTDPP